MSLLNKLKAMLQDGENRLTGMATGGAIKHGAPGNTPPPARPQTFAEDDGMVQTAQGLMPLSHVNPGTPWSTPQAPSFNLNQMHQLTSSANNPVSQFGDISGGINIQGPQNPGFTPLQGTQSRRYMPIQNGYDQRIQY